MATSTETHETTTSATLNPGQIIAAVRQAAARKASALRRGPSANTQLVRQMGATKSAQAAEKAREVKTHQANFGDLRSLVARMALESENLRDRNGEEQGPDGKQHERIETTVDIIQPISRRGHHLYRLSRPKLLRWVAPKNTFEKGMYMRGVEAQPNKPPDPNAVQYRTRRTGRAWVIPAHQSFMPEPKGNRGRVPFEPARQRPNDVIIEIPEKDAKGHERFRSWLGGVEFFDEEPPAGSKAPRRIGTGPDGKGTYFSRAGFKGASTGFHEDHALEDLTAIGHPAYLYRQNRAITHYIGKLADIEDVMLNRIGEENGVTPQQLADRAKQGAEYRASQPGAPTPPTLSTPRP